MKKRIHTDSLRAWRASLAITTREAARRLGISQSCYSKLELGQRQPRRELTRRLIRSTGVSLGSLMGISE